MNNNSNNKQAIYSSYDMYFESLVMARTIYGEARGEYHQFGKNSLIAIGNVIHNRYLHFLSKKFKPKFHKVLSHSGVCLQPKQFSCWYDHNYNVIKDKMPGDNEIFDVCFNIAKAILDNKCLDVTNQADHYHSGNISPWWAKNIQPITKIGNHTFYHVY